VVAVVSPSSELLSDGVLWAGQSRVRRRRVDPGPGKLLCPPRTSAVSRSGRELRTRAAVPRAPKSRVSSGLLRLATQTGRLEPFAMPPDLKALVDACRGVPPNAADLDEKVRSFAYGNLAIEHPETTREAIDRAVDEMNERRRGLAE
jgi:hypothetical protein